MIQDLTDRYQLPVEFLRDLLAKKEKQLPKGCQVSSNLIVSKHYQSRQVCKVRGILRAITKPTSINQLSTKFEIEEVRLKTIIDELVKTEQVAGKMAKGLFVPSTFSNTQIVLV